VYGKRVRKKMIRALKKQLAIYRNIDKQRYLALVNASSDILGKARDGIRDLGIASDVMSPSVILELYGFRYPDVIGVFKIDPKDISDLKLAYEKRVDKKNRLNSMESLKYGNLLMDEVVNYTKQDLSRVSKFTKHECDGKYDASCPACKYEKFIKDGYDDVQIKELVGGYNSDQEELVIALKKRLKRDIVTNEHKQPSLINDNNINGMPFSVLSKPMENIYAKKII